MIFVILSHTIKILCMDQNLWLIFDQNSMQQYLWLIRLKNLVTIFQIAQDIWFAAAVNRDRERQI